LPVAQKTQAMGHPDWLDTQTVARSSYTMSTDSTGEPSGKRYNALRVRPLSPVTTRSTASDPMTVSSARRFRSAAGRSVMSSGDPTRLT
jgi:hypothetical protein